MADINWKELFPSTLSFLIFIGYMSLFVAQGIFVTASKDENNSYAFDTVTVVLLTELLKLCISVVLYCRENTFGALLVDVKHNSNTLMLYLIPAFLYCLYNNLAFYNLAVFDPTTYFLLLQFRVVLTAILFQFIFKRTLSRRQWLSLILLTFGCMIKQLNLSNSVSDVSTSTDSDLKQEKISINLDINIFFIFVQTLCSCLAGVYNEYLLKNKSKGTNIFVQNVFMYIDSILCNALILMLQGNLFNAFTLSSLRNVMHFKVIIIIINNSAIGIVTSFFLKYLNSILKTFASALELIFTAILSYLLFAIPIHLNTIIAIMVVSLAVYLYSQSPVVNAANQQVQQTKTSRRKQDDEQELLAGSDADEDLVMQEVKTV